MQNEKTSNKKKIIIGVPNHFGLPEEFEKNLTFLGFSPFLIRLEDKKIKLPLKEKIIHGFRKLIFKDKTYKQKKSSDFHCKAYVNQLKSNNEKYDYALLIRPDLASENLLKTIRSKTSTFCAYQWDGLERYQFDSRFFEYFDRFFVFDKTDLAKDKRFQLLNNFYFDYFDEGNYTIKQDVFFVGTYQPNRIEKVISFAEKLNLAGLKTNINILGTDNKVNSKFINYSNKIIGYRENLDNVLQSKAILDFNNPVHEGLSLRVMESIGYEKKLITDNQLIKEFDFYNENNIFILEENFSTQALEEFIQKPYQKLAEETQYKYSFTNWIRYVFEIKPNIN